MTSTLEIKNGGLELIHSGTMIVETNNQTVFTLTDDGPPLHLVFEFQNTEQNPNVANVKANTLAENTIQLLFINCNNVLGNWSVKPIPIGGMFNRELWMYYKIASLIDRVNNSDLKQVTYSFYLGDTFGTNPLFKKGGANG